LLNGKNGASYNVGSEHPISIVDLAKMIKRIYGSKKIIRIEKTIKKQSKPSFYIPSTLIAQKTLNLQEHFPFEEGVKKTIRYAELIYL
jgi:dTDP-D-glucose 4,6-dehydratase